MYSLRQARSFRFLLALVVAVFKEVHAVLKIVSATRTARRMLVGSGSWEYIEVDVRFDSPVYVTGCSKKDAVYVAEAGRCVSCPPGCVLSAIFSRFPFVPNLLPNIQSNPECICGVSFEEMALRIQGWPGDQGFDVLQQRRLAYIHGLPSAAEAYGTAIWQFDALMIELDCPNAAQIGSALAQTRRFGLNLPPVDNGLFWLRRFDTAFGIEEVDRLLANVTRYYDPRRATFLLPVNRIQNGMTRKVGLTYEDVASCTMTFPFLVDRAGERAQTVKMSDLKERRFSCTKDGVNVVYRQMEAVMAKVLSAGRQVGQCLSDWRTTFPARGSGGPGGTFGIDDAFDFNASDASFSPYTSEASGRMKRVGILALRQDFSEPKANAPATVPCAVLRWQLRLKSHNLRERAVSYTALDKLNGCWDAMARSVQFKVDKVNVESRSCSLLPEQPESAFDPCCNPKLLRKMCCPKQNRTIEKLVPLGINVSRLARSCRVDTGNKTGFAKVALAAIVSYQRRVTEPSAMQSTWQNFAFEEQAHAAMWRTVEQCHADVMGRFDRETGMYIGSACLLDSDCFTECKKPALKTLKVSVSLKSGSTNSPMILGRCLVPATDIHVYIVKCLVRRNGKEVTQLLATELGLAERDQKEESITDILLTNGNRTIDICVGPYATPGVSVNESACLAKRGCNWHHEISTRQECLQSQSGNDNFCGCATGACPQQSLSSGCKTGAIYTYHCQDAREMLRPVELTCEDIATTPEELLRCHTYSDAHGFMMRRCMSSSCGPIVLYIYADQMCLDNLRREFEGCYDTCILPSGPNPTKEVPACFYELWPNETEKECFKTPGDTRVQYAPPNGSSQEAWDSGLTLVLPLASRPRYCTIQVWQELQDIRKPRFLNREATQLLAEASAQASQANLEERTAESRERDRAVYLAKNPPKFKGCDLGPLPTTAASMAKCKAKPDLACCFLPSNSTTGYCKECALTNDTVCLMGDKVMAVWAPNMQTYGAVLKSDLGGGVVNIAWDNGGIYYREVPWSWLWSLRGPPCHPLKDGCSTHEQCTPEQYCFGCEACRAAYGGNPPPGLCDPCPTHRRGACGPKEGCRVLQDSITGICPSLDALDCPCKTEWSVRFEYPSALTEYSINGCYLDKSKGYRWCEVDEAYYGTSCPVSGITGQTRFIVWRKCTPQSCDHCHCDCSQTCTAYDLLPSLGRLPPGVISGELNATIDKPYLQYSGTVAPNCSKGSSARLRGLCTFCVQCCADYCNQKAEKFGGFDCTKSKVSGCSDRLKGWQDSVGRSCVAYVQNSLCTQGGLYGLNWKYNPPKTFQDFATSSLSALSTCCDCGGGVACSNHPFNWLDGNNHSCLKYESERWCNRSGYGPFWDPAWGRFPAGTDGVDAISACCFCGGGLALERQTVQNKLVMDEGECRNVWPGRSQWKPLPWFQNSRQLCQLIGGSCVSKVTATVYDPSFGSAVPDNPRIFGICRQISFDTGTLPYLQDWQMSIVPSGNRRLSTISRDMVLKPLNTSQILAESGAAVTVDYNGNFGKSMCTYRLPDPLELHGGPNRLILPPPLLPPEDAEDADVLSRPSLHVLGWPGEFQGALFEDGNMQTALGLSTNVLNTEHISNILRGLLARSNVDLVAPVTFNSRVADWMDKLGALQCQPDFSKFYKDLSWQAGILSDGRSCVRDRCSVDKRITDENVCGNMQGCTATCTYCSPRSMRTLEQGLCYSTAASDVANCKGLGGLRIQDMVFDEITGINRNISLCALPHRPLIYCQSEGQFIKRCANLNEEHCESDPLGRLLGCGLVVQPCKTSEDCLLSGTCSVEDLSLNNAIQGTCVVTPFDDDLVQQGCLKDGHCIFRTDPPFGMDVRMRHGMLDLSQLHLGTTRGTPLEDASAAAASIAEAARASQMSSAEQVRARIRGLGRLNQTECEQLDLGEPFKASWIEMSTSPQTCGDWKSCCLLHHGDRCELYTGQAVNTRMSPELALVRQTECELCGGVWENIFRWTPGSWVNGQMISSHHAWLPRAWTSVNKWSNVVDINAIRNVFENALESRIARARLNAARGIIEPLITTLKTVAAACGDDSEDVDAGVAFSELSSGGKLQGSILAQSPSSAFELGFTMATSGLVGSAEIGGVSVAWHEYSTDKFGDPSAPPVKYKVSIEPAEFYAGAASTQVALPGRTTIVRNALENFGLQLSLVTTTISPANMETLQAQGAIPGGYPPWLINDMIAFNKGPTDEASKAVVVDASTLRDELIRQALERARAADASSGLPKASVDAVEGNPPPVLTNFSGDGHEFVNVSEGLYDGSCRHVVANAAGEVIGQLLGDCILFQSSTPIVNSVELCVPVPFATAETVGAFNTSAQAQLLGIDFDFAQKTVVPETYELAVPESLPGGIVVPGQLGSILWSWPENATYGRLLPGTPQLQPLGLAAVLRDSKGGKVLCSKVYGSEQTYCPIVRLKTDFYRRLWSNATGTPEPNIPEVFSLESSCSELDMALASIHSLQALKNNLELSTYRRICRYRTLQISTRFKRTDCKQTLRLYPSGLFVFLDIV